MRSLPWGKFDVVLVLFLAFRPLFATHLVLVGYFTDVLGLVLVLDRNFVGRTLRLADGLAHGC